MAPDVQGINRYRYSRSLMCLEELAEALTFAHYLKTQTLLKPEELSAFVEELTRKGAVSEEKDKDEPMPDAGNTPVPTTSGEQEATTTDDNEPVETEQQPKPEPPTMSTTIDDYFYGVFDLSGEMMRFATTSTALTGKMAGAEDDERTIVEDMHELGSFFEMLPTKAGDRKQWEKKLDVMRQSVRKVERLGYDRKIRGSERPKGWVPDLTADQPGEDEE